MARSAKGKTSLALVISSMVMALAISVFLGIFGEPPQPRGVAKAPGNAELPPRVAPLPLSGVNFIKQASLWGRSADEGPGFDLSGLMAANYYVVLDGSGSMGETGCAAQGQTRAEAAKDAVAKFVQAVPEGANLGLFVFDRAGASERVELGRGPANRTAFVRAVRAMAPSGKTPLGASIQAGLTQLSAQAERQVGYGEYHLVIITDGAASDPQVMEEALNAVIQTPVIVQTIGFCVREGHALNRPGRTLYRNANDPESLGRGLAAVLAESDDFGTAGFTGGGR